MVAGKESSLQALMPDGGTSDQFQHVLISDQNKLI